jgi:hypothetical protein
MPEIRYVCLSDTHFGADNSLLTYLGPGQQRADPLQQSPVLKQLMLCLRTLIGPGQERPTLVLNGDILELALATDDQAAMAFERFLDLAFPQGEEPLFQDRVFYLPGNHDHHLWETAREAQYLVYLAEEAPPHERIKEPWHATNLFPQRRRKGRKTSSAQFLNTLARRRGLDKVSFEVAYPNLGILSQDERRAVLFTHGHFAEPIYTLVTRLVTLLFPKRVTPTQVWDYEAENFAWIDFFWSALGRSGSAGKEVELIYDKMQDPAALAGLLQNLTRGLVQRFVPGLLSFAKSWVLRSALRGLLEYVGKLEARQKDDGPLTKDTREALEAYVTGPLLRQIQGEHDSSPPAEVTLVFGHTHKPFEQLVSYGGYAEDVRLYNSGGWVVDSVDVTAQAGWAVILVDENLDVASLRGAGDATASGVQVAEAALQGAAPNPLCQHLMSIIDSQKAPWTSFGQALETSISNHLANLKRKIASSH